MMNFKIKLLCLLCAIAAWGNNALASDWIGEAMDMDKEYYFVDKERFDAGKDAFLSYTLVDGTYYVTYSDYEHASLFIARKAGIDKTIYLENQSIGNLQIKNNGENKELTYVGDGGTNYNKNPTYSKTIGYTFSLTSTGNITSIEGISSVNDNDYITSIKKTANGATKKWFFISPEQFTERPKLDKLVSEILDKYGSEDRIPGELREMYDQAKKAQTHVPAQEVKREIGPKIINTYTNLEASYQKALAIENRISEGAGFNLGTDFSSYILNNSFQLGNTDYWTVTDSRGRNVNITIKNEQFKSSANGQTLSQVVSGLPAGSYKLEATLSTSAIFNAYIINSKGTTTVEDKSDFEIKAGEQVKIEVTGPINFTADDFKLTLTGGKATEITYKQSISIGSTGYATCVSNYDLDFSECDDITAYGVVPEMETNIAHFVELTKVPAQTAFVVKGTEGTHEVPMCRESNKLTDEQNQFVYRDKAISGNEYSDMNIYYLGVSDGQAVFKKLASTGTLAAKKGYFTAPSANAAPMFRIAMDPIEEEATSIEAISTEEATGIYTLSGNKLDKISKNGLYIVNGKKVRINTK